MIARCSGHQSCSEIGCESCRDLSQNVHFTHISTVKRAKILNESLTMDPKKKRSHQSNECVSLEKKACIDMFNTWSCKDQVDFLCNILSKMSHFQQSQVNILLEPLLKRDFIVAFRIHGVPHLAESILSQLDAPSLLSVELVSRGWQWSVAKYQLWRRLIARRVATDPVWHGLVDRRGWLELIYLSDPVHLPVALGRRFVTVGTLHKHPAFPLLASKATCGTGIGATCLDSSCRPSATCPRCNPPNNSVDVRRPVPQPIHVIPDESPCKISSGDFPSQSCELCRANETPAKCHASFSFDADRNDAVSPELIMFAHQFYKQLYPRIIKEIKRVEENWSRGNYHLTRIPCRSDVTKGVYCLQYDKDKIVSGLRDDTIKVWRRLDPGAAHSPDSRQLSSASRSVIILRNAGFNEIDHRVNVSVNNAPGPAADADPNHSFDDGNAAEDRTDDFPSDAGADGYHCTQVLEGHTGSVLCLQYIGNLLISGSSDTTVRLWDLSTGHCLNVINHHAEAVLHLRFRNKILVTCSKDRSIAVWDMGPWPRDLMLRQVLVGHRAAVNVVDFDDKYIVSASGDRTIKVWDTETCAYVRTLTGHRRGIACLQYRDRLVVSGSSDNTIRIWDIETGVCFRVLEGHEELVRCIRFDSKHIVSGAYDGKIKVWSLKHALDPRSKPSQLCIHTLQQHTGRVFRLQFDDFQIVSSSHDDTILIWDFARPSTGNDDRDDGFDDGMHTVLSSQVSRFPLPNVQQKLQDSVDNGGSANPAPQSSCSMHSSMPPNGNEASRQGSDAVEMESESESSAARTIQILAREVAAVPRSSVAMSNSAFNRIPNQPTGDQADRSTLRPSSSVSFRNLHPDT